MSREEMYFYGWIKCYRVNPTKTAREATTRFPIFELEMKKALHYLPSDEAFAKAIGRCLNVKR